MAKDWKRVSGSGKSTNDLWVKIVGILFVASMIAIVFFDPLSINNKENTEGDIIITGVTTNFATGGKDQWLPDSAQAGNWVVFQNNSGATGIDIYAKNVNTMAQVIVANTAIDETEPKVDGDLCVWKTIISGVDYLNGKLLVSPFTTWSKTFVHNTGGSDYPVTILAFDIYGNNLYFSGNTGGGEKVVGKFVVGSASYSWLLDWSQSGTLMPFLVANDKYVVWARYTSINFGFQVYDIGSGVTGGGGGGVANSWLKSVRIYGDTIVFCINGGNDSSDRYIQTYKISTGVTTTMVDKNTGTSGSPKYADISSEWFVYNWADLTGTESKVYAYHLTKQIRYLITASTNGGLGGLIVINNVVYFTKWESSSFYGIYKCVLHITEEPEITHTPVTGAYTGSSMPIQLYAYDDVAIHNASVYWKIGAGSLNKLEMAYIGSEATKIGDWIAYIPSRPSPCIISYYLEIWDEDAGGTPENKVTKPSSSVEQYFYDITIIDNDITAPTITHTQETFANVSQTILISAQITDNIAVDNVMVYYKNVGAGSYLNINMIKHTGTLQNGIWEATIPAQTIGGIVYYYIWAEDTSANSVDTPVYMINIDTSAPLITHTPVTVGYLNVAINIVATITDAQGVDNDTVVMKYRNAGTFVDIYQDMLLISGNITDGVWRGIIPAQTYDGTVPYMVYASDLSANAGSTPLYSIVLSDDTPPPQPPTGEVGNITGIVVDKDDVPIQGVTVSVEGSDITDTTNSEGVFNLTGVETGTQTLNVSKSGYTSKQVDVDVEANTSTTISNITLLVGDDIPDPTPAPTDYTTYIIIGVIVAIVAGAGVYLYKRKGKKGRKKWRK